MQTILKDAGAAIVDKLKDRCTTQLEAVVSSIRNCKSVKEWHFEANTIDDTDDAIELGSRTLMKEDFSLAEKQAASCNEAFLIVVRLSNRSTDRVIERLSDRAIERSSDRAIERSSKPRSVELGSS